MTVRIGFAGEVEPGLAGKTGRGGQQKAGSF